MAIRTQAKLCYVAADKHSPMLEDHLRIASVYEAGTEVSLDDIYDDFGYQDDGAYRVKCGDVEGEMSALDVEQAGTGFPDLPNIVLSVHHGQLTDDSGTTLQECVLNLLDLIRELYTAGHLRPSFLYGHPYHWEQAIRDVDYPPITRETLAEGCINYATWLNIFSPRLFRTYGPEILSTAPAWRTDELESGAILLVAFEDPLGTGSVHDLNEHLGCEGVGPA